MIVFNLIFHCLFVEIKYRFEFDKFPPSGGKKKKLIIKELLANIINHSDIVQFSKNQQKHLHADETSSILPFICWLPVYELDSFFFALSFFFLGRTPIAYLNFEACFSAGISLPFRSMSDTYLFSSYMLAKRHQKLIKEPANLLPNVITLSFHVALLWIYIDVFICNLIKP